MLNNNPGSLPKLKLYKAPLRREGLPMKSVFYLLSSVLLLLSLFSCHKNGTKPPETELPDTTSHNITWQTFEFGIYPSILRDVAVISENDIWAVGEIHTEETKASPEYDPYNAVHWDGQKWELKRIQTNACGGVVYPPLECVFKLSDGNIVFSDGSQIIHYNGNTFSTDCSLIPKLTGGVRKIWGISKGDFYVVGTSGFIAHYDGHSWTKIESGTDVDLTDIYGTFDGIVVWVSGFNDLKGSILLRNGDNGFETMARVEKPGIPDSLNKITKAFKNVWTDNKDMAYVAAIGRIYYVSVNNTLNEYNKENIWYDYRNEPGYPNETWAFRGNSENDLFVAGYKNFVRHYNGKSWYQYDEILNEGFWYAIYVKDNLVVAVGSSNDYISYARVCVGLR